MPQKSSTSSDVLSSEYGHPQIRYIPIAGTWYWRASDVQTRDYRWYERGSPFWEYLRVRGYEHLHCNRPFVWSTDLAGVTWVNKLFKRTGHESWAAAGYNLFHYLNGNSYRHRNIISHSHGLQPVLFAAAAGLKVRTLVDISGPHRHDLKSVIKKALPNIGLWVHVYGDWRDTWQWLGGVMDGGLGIKRAFEYPNVVNVQIDNIGHSSLLNDPRNLPLWETHGLLNYIQRG